VSFALDAFVARVAPATVLAEVQQAWPDAAGPMFSTTARPIAERDGTVRVACRSAVYAQELELLSERVVAALNAQLGREAVKRLRCEVSTREL
jgi:hypothetical protein